MTRYFKIPMTAGPLAWAIVVATGGAYGQFDRSTQ
jgi:hypothetical protein